VEWLAAREQVSFVSPVPRAAAPAHPVVEAQRAEDTDEHDSLGWTAYEEAQEPSDAMTIIGEPVRDDEQSVPSADETQPEPEPEPEPELPPAAEEQPETTSRRWWRRRHEQDGTEAEPESPRHVRVLPADEEPPRTDPWEEGFDEAELDTDEAAQPERR
jgi:hypothetical protein